MSAARPWEQEGWQAVIGLEIHVQLATRSKLFSGASTAYGAEPNSQVSAIDLGLPGTLPVPNREALAMAIRFGLAVEAEIARESVFARKNYFYPDLPKGYQTSQYERPILAGGRILYRDAAGAPRSCALTRAHLEEDAGKSLHEAWQGQSAIDLNRAGTPLLEVVTEPVLHDPLDAGASLRALHTLVRWLGICDGNMQEGSFRCDANVSVRRLGETRLGTRAEIKNVNSFRFVEKAIEYEIQRQIRVLEGGGQVDQETRAFDAARGTTRSLRGKESAHDYRYFPCPDLPPLRIGEDWIAAERATLPELPDTRRQRFEAELGLPPADAAALCQDRPLADYFETVLAALPGQARLCANWVLVELGALLNERGLDIAASPLPANRLAGLLLEVAEGRITQKVAKALLPELADGTLDAAALIATKGLTQIADDGALVAEIDAVLAEFPTQLAQYRSGQDKLLQFFVGQVMRRTRGQAHPGELNRLLRQRLDAGD